MTPNDDAVTVRVGCAGWSIPKEHAARFPDTGSHLVRYAQCFSAVEINSSFYRPHRPATYARWADSVPAGFRFAVKMPREITHERRLTDIAEPLDRFLTECGTLDNKLGPLLVQLPPSLVFRRDSTLAFFDTLRQRFGGNVVCEPRHPSWFAPESDALLVQFQIARVAADPAPVPDAAQPGGWPGLTYRRLHGSPRIYYSAYSDEFLATLVRDLQKTTPPVPAWCIFDNTALGAATADALWVQDHIAEGALE